MHMDHWSISSNITDGTHYAYELVIIMTIHLQTLKLKCKAFQMNQNIIFFINLAAKLRHQQMEPAFGILQEPTGDKYFYNLHNVACSSS